MWTLFLIITLNANSDYPTMLFYNKTAIEGGLSSYEIGFFRDQEDCLKEALALIEMYTTVTPINYLAEYTCFPTRSEPE